MNEISNLIGPGSGFSTSDRRIVERAGDDRPAAPLSRAPDRVEISEQARESGTVIINSDRPIRHELVDRLRGEIRAGTYATEDKIDAVVDRLTRAVDLQA
ncbi:MAG: flagellar biosynthesis anti-sigma factor FlgM [Phycisphaeraceae bacterium]|nr:flagellar biosynthesis anti-sigma factor FlgM [Phycisphaeraceae bacterium]